MAALLSSWLPLPPGTGRCCCAPATRGAGRGDLPGGFILVVIGLIVIGLSQLRPLEIALRSRRALVVGRALLVLPVRFPARISRRDRRHRRLALITHTERQAAGVPAPASRTCHKGVRATR